MEPVPPPSQEDFWRDRVRDFLIGPLNRHVVEYQPTLFGVGLYQLTSASARLSIVQHGSYQLQNNVFVRFINHNHVQQQGVMTEVEGNAGQLHDDQVQVLMVLDHSNQSTASVHEEVFVEIQEKNLAIVPYVQQPLVVDDFIHVGVVLPVFGPELPPEMQWARLFSSMMPELWTHRVPLSITLQPLAPFEFSKRSWSIAFDEKPGFQISYIEVDEQVAEPVIAEEATLTVPIADPNTVAEPQTTTQVIRKRRGKAAAPNTVDKVRRSDRLAGLAAGFKDKPPTDAVANTDEDADDDLENTFKSHVIDEAAPAPPHLSVPMMQALGTGPCQMAPTMLSEAELNFPNVSQ